MPKKGKRRGKKSAASGKKSATGGAVPSSSDFMLPKSVDEFRSQAYWDEHFRRYEDGADGDRRSRFRFGAVQPRRMPCLAHTPRCSVRARADMPGERRPGWWRSVPLSNQAWERASVRPHSVHGAGPPRPSHDGRGWKM